MYSSACGRAAHSACLMPVERCACQCHTAPEFFVRCREHDTFFDPENGTCLYCATEAFVEEYVER